MPISQIISFPGIKPRAMSVLLSKCITEFIRQVKMVSVVCLWEWNEMEIEHN